MDIGSIDDYYGLLGINAEADAAELRRAWRQLALQWHPDRAGPGATAIFQKLSLAYEVLSDPVARAAYDRRRRRAERSPGTHSGAATKPTPATAPRATPGVLLRRLSGPLNALIASGVARRAEDDVIELILNPHEAAEGGMVTIPMRVPVHCQACASSAVGSCAKCGGKRTLDELFSAWLAIPPQVADGTILTPSAMMPGMVRPVSFRVRLRGSG